MRYLSTLLLFLIAANASIAQTQEFVCWRMLPVAPAQRDAFRAELAKLKAVEPQSEWHAIMELSLAAEYDDRTAFRKAIEVAPVKTPSQFPLVNAEKLQRESIGKSRVQSSLEAISSRNYAPLHALRNLDRALTREAGFCKDIGDIENLDQILAVRDRLRQSYLRSSRHLVEKLFALTLNGQLKERDALLVKAKSVPYLHDRGKLAAILDRVGEDKAWSLVIEPLLTSEIAVIDNPPNVSAFQRERVTDLEITADNKKTSGTTVQYDGHVRLQLGTLSVTCQTLIVVKNDAPESVVLTGDGGVRLSGIEAYPNAIIADRFTFHAETGSFSLGGNVRLGAKAKILKLRSCTVTRGGDVLNARSWLDDFRNALTVDAKLRLLPDIGRVYSDDELPDEVRFLMALDRLSPLLTWRAPYLPPMPERRELLDQVKRSKDVFRGSAWQESLGGELWMHREDSDKYEQAFRKELRDWYERYHERIVKGDPNIKMPELAIPDRDLYFWRLRSPNHQAIRRCLELLDSIRNDELRGKASRWAAEIRCNNTVLTFDIAGAATAGKSHSLLMDVRNAEQVAFKLYRVNRPEELLFATRRIGMDFIYRDHGLDEGRHRKDVEIARKAVERMLRAHDVDKTEFVPAWTKEQLVHVWNVRVADLRHFPSAGRFRWDRWHFDDGNDEPDAHYFDDECSEHRERLEKAYRPEPDSQLSSWQCDRVVTIPDAALKQHGAYVLVAEANGQVAHVPIVVDPLSLTMRRCRDGVFVLASNSEGSKPLAGADVLARGMRGNAVTDHEGAAFARVLAFGDRAIVIHHEGRYAIGGFGQVFDGIYEAHDSWPLREQLARQRKEIAKTADPAAHLYADRHVVVAYTDRPTYRPNQEVRFKLIVRKLQTDKAAIGETPTFRAEEFDATTTMTLPNLDQPIRYVVLDPKGIEIANGTVPLSDFGTAAGQFTLNEETALGAYSLRVRIAGTPRLVPDAFTVKQYRRPNFEVKVDGIPEKLTAAQPIALSIAGRYYFGEPVKYGVVDVRVTRKDGKSPVAEDHAKTNDKGDAKINLDLPTNLSPGRYFVSASITDASGRTESSTSVLTIESQERGNGITELPRFLAVNEERAVKTSAKSIRAERQLGDVINVSNFAAKDGTTLIKFSSPGWYRLKAGDDEADLFVYGGKEHPEFHLLRERAIAATWVNLSDFAYQEHNHHSRFENRSENLWALFDQQSLKVGEKLRLLVYVPHKDARLLFTFEGRTILDYAVISMIGKVGPFHVIELPIKERHFPNVYLQGRILPQAGSRVLEEAFKQAAKDAIERDDDDRDPRWCRIDVSRPAGQGQRQPLKVHVETDRNEYRPGDPVHATIKVTDHLGNPRVAELSLAAVDDSVFTFGEDNLDALPAFFSMPYEPRRFLPKAWRTSVGRYWSGQRNQAIRDLQKQLEQRMVKEAIDKASATSLPELRDSQYTLAPLPRLGGEMPAAQIPIARFRQHFQETATWLPQLRTDDAGKAQATFTLPDSLTRYRLTSVALTKSTEVGVGRTHVTASLPLAVQLFLPRFGIEKDRVQAVALIHNRTDQPRECSFAWQMECASADGPTTGKIVAPANGSIKVGLLLNLDQIGTARIAFRASDGKDADAEVRTLPIQPLGKAAEIKVNHALAPARVQPGEKQLAGKFIKDGIIKLPAGFVASELHLSLASSDLAQGLDGLDYLVDYPHGCIEQTMSRFMPAVMVKHATQHSPVVLQPEIAKKLPDVLEKGLLRVYGHQHTDGSWGWFEKDGGNLPMSIYVVYGLARCKATGTKVDEAVLKRGCDYLKWELQKNTDLNQTARAWLALALAGQVDVKELEKVARAEAAQVGWQRDQAWCNLALACKAAGLNEAGERLWSRIHGLWRHGWWGHDTESFALLLNTQLAFGAPYADCRLMANRILEKRSGTQWEHTRSTAAAVEALANMLGYVHEKDAVRRIEVTLGGKKILDVGDAAERKKLVHRIHLKADQLPTTEGLEIHLKSDADEPIHVALRATGVQRLDEVPASGERVKLTRTLETLDGKSITGPLAIGQVARVRLQLQLTQPEAFVMIEERRPSLCEFAADHLEGGAAQRAVHHDWRDDRLCVSFSSLNAGTHEVVYYLRAETAGRCTVLPGTAYPMYNDRQRGDTASMKLEVNDNLASRVP